MKGRAPLLVLIAASVEAASVAPKPYVETDPADLVSSLPELAGVEPALDQSTLPEILRFTGQKTADTFARFVNVSAVEEIHEMRFDAGSMEAFERREKFRYVVRLAPEGSVSPIQEVRMALTADTLVRGEAKPQFLIAGQFLTPLNRFLPPLQKQSRFRYVGMTKDGAAYVIAFGDRTGAGQGLAWVEAANYRIARVQERASADLWSDAVIAPVAFQSIHAELPMPFIVTVDARTPGGVFHTVHRYSDFRMFGLNDDKEHAGVSLANPMADDAFELISRGVLAPGKPADALPSFRQATEKAPDNGLAHYHLAAALQESGDVAGAEIEFRLATALMPDSNPVRNRFGIVLFKRGKSEDAAKEFRTAASLDPKDTNAHSNLGSVLASMGDRDGAKEEYRLAASLEPDNAALQARYQQFSGSAPAAEGAEPTIRVDVRQILVPVVVTDKLGHHVPGLKQTDFTVLEDGVEQRISAFGVEESGLAMTGGTKAANSQAPEVVSPGSDGAKASSAKRTYLICIDAMHASFGNIPRIREALKKLFEREKAGDSRYAVIAIGSTATTILQNTTTDPELVLKALDSKAFLGLATQSRATSLGAETNEYRRTLNEVREEIDSPDPITRQMGMARKPSLLPQAHTLAHTDRNYTTEFLRQFATLIERLTHASDRRTVILISDGFSMVPGKEAYELLSAFFPDIREAMLYGSERMQDQFEPIVRMASKSNIPIYTVDSRGLYVDSTWDASREGVSASVAPAVMRAESGIASDAGGTLQEFAAATGGTAYYNSNDLFLGLERAFADGRNYYLLAYNPANRAADGKFRTITVRLRDAHLTANAKRGYWADGKAK